MSWRMPLLSEKGNLMAAQPENARLKPFDPSTLRPESPRPVYKIASSPEPADIDSTGWSASQGVSAAYRFADAIRRDAARD